MIEYLILAAILICSYLMGSFPSAVIISKRFFGFDIRTKGSGNMGSTNAFRVLGVKWGIVTQILDILKGSLPILIVSWVFTQGLTVGTMHFGTIVLMLIAGAGAILGHIYSMFVNFKGGKGINTALGVLIAITPIDVGIAALVFIIFVSFSGYISLGSIMGSLAFPTSIFIRKNLINAYIPDYDVLIYFAIVTASLLIFAHRSNVVRLLKGEENKFEKLQLIKLGKKKENS
jgi:glycerol-3-phosphate acyltransferase PlsY